MKTVKANALIVTVIVALILSIISLSFISASYYNTFLRAKFLAQERLVGNIKSAITYSLTDTITYAAASENLIRLFTSEEDSVSIKRYPWGLFTLINVSA